MKPTSADLFLEAAKQALAKYDSMNRSERVKRGIETAKRRKALGT